MARVNISKFKEIVAFIARAKREHGITCPILVWGKQATGKTSSVRQTAVAINDILKAAGGEVTSATSVTLNLANQTPEELLGFPSKDEKSQTTIYFRPSWMLDEPNTQVFYFLDEINRAPKYVLQSMFNFINEGRLHDHSIKPIDIVIAAANPPTEEFEVTDFDDAAFISRFAHFELEPDLEEVLKYFAANKDIDPIVQDVMKEAPAIDSDVPAIKIVPDFRMYERAGLLLKIMKEAELESFGSHLMTAMLGPDISTLILRKAKDRLKDIKAEDLLTGKVKLSSIPLDRIDVITVLNANIARYFKSKGWAFPDKNGKITAVAPTSVLKIIASYVEYIPRDSAIALIKDFKIQGTPTKVVRDYVLTELSKNFLYELLEVQGSAKR